MTKGRTADAGPARAPHGNRRTVSPWEQDPDESSQAFGSFALYRDMGPTRTLPRLAKALGRGIGRLKKLSMDWDWRARVLEFDRWADRAAQKVTVARRAEAAARHAQIGRMLQLKAVQGAEKLKAEDTSAFGIARMAAEGVKIERLTMGESTENVDATVAAEVVNVDARDFAVVLSDPALAAAARSLGRALLARRPSAADGADQPG